MAEEAVLHYKRQQKLCQLVQLLAAGEDDAIVDRIYCGNYRMSFLADALAMIEKDGILNAEEARAVAVRVAEKIVQQTEKGMANDLARARVTERLLEEEFRPVLAELQGEHGDIL